MIPTQSTFTSITSQRLLSHTGRLETHTIFLPSGREIVENPALSPTHSQCAVSVIEIDGQGDLEEQRRRVASALRLSLWSE
jgi:hypothetical protein